MIYAGALNDVGKVAMASHKRNYNASEEDILIAVSDFNDEFIAGGIIDEMSSNYHKYLRGWMACLFRRNSNE